jgi:hypothetical protein
MSAKQQNVRYWHKPDMELSPNPMSAFDPKRTWGPVPASYSAAAGLCVRP